MPTLLPPPLTPAAWLRFDAIRRGLAAVRPTRVLEVGAGEGALAWRLARRFDYLGLEPDPASFRVASTRLAALGRGRILPATTAELERGPREAPFDLVCAFEVLEHVPDHVEELGRWHRLLRPGGAVLVSVPAHRARFGPADEAVGHMRRYDRADLEEALAGAGFRTVWIEAWGAGLGHALEWVRHRLAARARTRAAAEQPAHGTARSGRWLQPRGWVLGGVAALAAAPGRLLQLPVRGTGLGIGWVALARRDG